MPPTKVSPALADRLAHAAADEWLEVVVAVRSTIPAGVTSQTATRAERVDIARQLFAEDSEPVVRAIQSIGGQITNSTWLGHALAVHVRADRVSDLQALDAVLSLDLPQQLRPEL